MKQTGPLVRACFYMVGTAGLEPATPCSHEVERIFGKSGKRLTLRDFKRLRMYRQYAEYKENRLYRQAVGNFR